MQSIWKPSASFGRPIRYIILHGTGMASEQAALERLCSIDHPVSSHYFIGANGNLYQLVEDKEIAWHAGISEWGKDKSLNFTSLGVELFNPSAGNKSPYTEAQYQALIKLLENLLQQYQIPEENVLGHSDIAPGRKTDPGYLFDWQRLYRAGVALPTPRATRLREHIIATKGKLRSSPKVVTFPSDNDHWSVRKSNTC
jgi:N-acetylmuramoyl-L-alanine amidase